MKRSEIVNGEIVAAEQKRERFGSGPSFRDPSQNSLIFFHSSPTIALFTIGPRLTN